MRLVNGKLYVEYAEAVRAGISPNTIKKAGQRSSNCWDITKDPTDQRKTLIGYEALKPSYKEQINDTFGNPYRYSSLELIDPLIKKDRISLDTLTTFKTRKREGLPREVIEKYSRSCDVLSMLANIQLRTIKGLGFSTAKDFYEAVIGFVEQEQLPLPVTYSKLRGKVRKFASEGATCVIDKKWGNTNSMKIEGAVADYLIAQYAQLKTLNCESLSVIYNNVAPSRGWPSLTPTGIYTFLYRDENVPKWYIGRHGVAAYKRKFEHHFDLESASCRDALWCSDGSKLNLFYLDKNKAVAKLNVYIVMDVYSELILGHCYDFTEDHISIWKAFKRALYTSNAKPYQILYDNQGGTRKKETQQFFKDIGSGCHFPSRPRNPQSKPVEGLIGRLQTYMKEFPLSEEHRGLFFFTGYSIKSKREDSEAHYEFIKEHKHLLPSLEEVQKIASYVIESWNADRHPKLPGSRAELYQQSTNPKHESLSTWELIDMLWFTTAKASTYRKGGIDLRIAGEKQTFEVYDPNGSKVPGFKRLDTDFHRDHVGTKFYSKYDPEDLSVIHLYKEDASGKLRHVATAEPKQKVPRAVLDMHTGVREAIEEGLTIRDQQIADRQTELDEIRERANIRPEQLIKEYQHVLANVNSHTKEEVHEAINATRELALEDVAVAEPKKKQRRSNAPKSGGKKDHLTDW